MTEKLDGVIEKYSSYSGELEYYETYKNGIKDGLEKHYRVNLNEDFPFTQR